MASINALHGVGPTPRREAEPYPAVQAGPNPNSDDIVDELAAELIAALASPGGLTGTPDLGLLPSPSVLFNSPSAGAGVVALQSGELPWFHQAQQHQTPQRAPTSAGSRVAPGCVPAFRPMPGMPVGAGSPMHFGVAQQRAFDAQVPTCGDNSGSDAPKARDYRGPRHHPLDAKLKEVFSTDELRLNQKAWQTLLRSRPLTQAELIRVKQLRRRSKCCVYSEGTRRKIRKGNLKAGCKVSKLTTPTPPTNTPARSMVPSQTTGSRATPAPALAPTEASEQQSEMVASLQAEVAALRAQLSKVTGMFVKQAARFDTIEAALDRAAHTPSPPGSGSE